MAEHTEFFRITEPPFAVFPDEPEQVVQDAFDWIPNVARLTEPEPVSAEVAPAFLDDLTKTLTRVGTDPVAAWIAMVQISGLIASEVGLAPDGFWELPREVFPPADELAKAAAQLLPTIEQAHGKDAIDPYLVEVSVLGEVKSATEGTLNSVCMDLRPAPRDLDDVQRVWALRALVSVLLSLRHESRNVMASVGALPDYTEHDPESD